MEFVDPERSDARRVFLSDALAPSDFMAFSYLGDNYQVGLTVGGGVDTNYASGRERVFTTPQRSRSVAVSFQSVTADQIAWLEDHAGRTVCFRDHLGRKVFGVYMDAPETVSTDPRLFASDSAVMSLASVTFDEAAA